MLVGHGIIASSFKIYKSDERFIIFASGVSNSLEKDNKEFIRERDLLETNLKENSDKLFIYFSSCSIEDSELKDTPYHIHKKAMEEIIKLTSKHYLIFRLPNIIGNGGSKNTIINFLINKITSNQKFELWENATRNIIDIEDVCKIVSYIIENRIFNNNIINISYDKNNKLVDIVNAIEIIHNKNAFYTVINKGVDLKIDNSKIKQIMKELGIVQPKIINILKKYKEL